MKLRSHIFVAFCVASLGSLPASVYAQAEPDSGDGWWQQASQTWRNGVTTHQVDIENDSLLLNRDDGMYTSGNRYRWQNWQSDARRAMMTEWRIAHEVYTPQDIKLPPQLVLPPDHPYAAWAYMGLAHTEWQIDGSLLGFGLDVGCLGPCAGGETVQTRLHRLIKQPLPRGWAKQVKNEWGAVLSMQWAGRRVALAQSADLQALAQLRGGNIHADVQVGGIVRMGKLNALPQQAAWYGFVQAQVRAVAYDATKQGGLFSKDNPHTVEPKRMFGEVEVGMRWQGPQFSGKLALVRRGNTIRTLPDRQGAQDFLVLQLGYTPGL